MDYWNDTITEKSWQILQQLKGQFSFTLIGGWAVWLWARTAKSKDIDIIVPLEVLPQLKALGLRNNPHLKKYELRREDIDIDIYVPFYSNLGLPLNSIQTTVIEGFTVPRIEELLILKQVAEQARGHSEKGEKDRIDILSILFRCPVNFTRYRQLLSSPALLPLLPRLIHTVRTFQDFRYLSLTPAQLSRKKAQLVEQLRRL